MKVIDDLFKQLFINPLFGRRLNQHRRRVQLGGLSLKKIFYECNFVINIGIG